MKNLARRINFRYVGYLLKHFTPPILLAVSLYTIFHSFIDNFLYTYASSYLHNGIPLFWVLVGWFACFYFFGMLFLFDSERKSCKYKWLQKVRKYSVYAEYVSVIIFIAIAWRALQLIPYFKYPQAEIKDGYFVALALLFMANKFIWYAIKSSAIQTDDEPTQYADKTKMQPDSVLSAVDLIKEDANPNNLFRKSAEGLSKIIKRVYDNKNKLLGEDSYIIGINGEWGSGKSTLVELVKQEMDNDVIIVEFNPWLSHQPANLTIDFFRTVASSLGSYMMRRTLIKYGIALSKVIKKDVGDALDLIAVEPSLESQFREICSYIKSRNLKLLIIIDDIDRMDGDEILAVLKLARRSGNLPNTVYLLAFNHEYVEAQICQKIKGKTDDTNDSFNYIDKIINLPFDVPKHTSEYFVEKLKETIPPSASQLERDSFFLPEIVTEKISNFRAYKKIYNKIVVQYNAYKDHIFLNDFIVLKTLQIYDNDIYKSLIEAIVETRKVFNPNSYPKDKEINEEVDEQNYGEADIYREPKSENEIIVKQLTSKYKSNPRAVDVTSLTRYIYENDYDTFIRRRLAISAIKLDQNTFSNDDDFDTLDFSFNNLESSDQNIQPRTLDGWLSKNNYPEWQSDFVAECLFKEPVNTSYIDPNYLRGIVYAYFIHSIEHTALFKCTQILCSFTLGNHGKSITSEEFSKTLKYLDYYARKFPSKRDRKEKFFAEIEHPKSYSHNISRQFNKEIEEFRKVKESIDVALN